jgi:hypothetical protein
MLADEEDRERPEAKIGRPKAGVDIVAAERGASIGCSMSEIATLCGVGERTLYDRVKIDPELREAIDRGRDVGRTTLRRLQWQRAEAGSDTMLIWLGKQMLGQKDKQDVTSAINSDIRVVVELVGEKPTPRPVREIEGERSPAAPTVSWDAKLR